MYYHQIGLKIPKAYYSIINLEKAHIVIADYVQPVINCGQNEK